MGQGSIVTFQNQIGSTEIHDRSFNKAHISQNRARLQSGIRAAGCGGRAAEARSRMEFSDVQRGRHQGCIASFVSALLKESLLCT